MSRTSRYAYILAKTYGILARSFVGDAYRDLLRLKSLAELSERLFPGERDGATDVPLPVDVERKALQASVRAMTGVLDYFKEPPALLVHAARKIEYQAAKSLVRAVAHGEAAQIPAADLGSYSGFRGKQEQDASKALQKSMFSWVLPLVGTMPLAALENRIDQDYYETFLRLASLLPARDRASVLGLARTEIALTNVIWALRLRFFFKMEESKARELMIPGTSAAVRDAVAAVFSIAPDSPEEWRRWRFGWLLDDQLGDAFRAPDPVRAELKASQALYVRARRSFHQNPFTLGPLVAFFRLKEREAAFLSIAAEALHLSVPEQDVLALVGVR